MSEQSKFIAVDSSNLRSVMYDPDSRSLYVRFKTGAVWRYIDVPPEKYTALMAAKSKGSFFSNSIRKKYDAQKNADIDPETDLISMDQIAIPVPSPEPDDAPPICQHCDLPHIPSVPCPKHVCACQVCMAGKCGLCSLSTPGIRTGSMDLADDSDASL